MIPSGRTCPGYEYVLLKLHIINQLQFPLLSEEGPCSTVRSGVVCHTNYYRDYSLRS